MILVTGANGNVGREVVNQLVTAGHDVRALLRSRARAESLPTTVEIAVGDFSDTHALARALEGADAVYMTSFEHPDLLRLQGNLISVARDAGVRVVARLSGMRADPESSAAISRNHALGDRQLAESGLGYVLLRPNWFHQNFLGYFPGGVMRLPVGAGRTTFIDVRDIAAVAVAALTDRRHLGETFELSGPEALSHAEVAQILSEATDRGFIFEDVAEEDWRAETVHRGMVPDDADALIGLFRRIREGAMAEVTGDVERVTGRPPIDLATFARDYTKALCRQL